MKSSKKVWLWGSFAIAGLSVGLLFQNCSPVQLSSGKIVKGGLSGTSSLSSLALQNKLNTDQQTITYNWATKTCAGSNCTVSNVGVGESEHISKPNKLCSASNIREAVTVRMKNNSTSKDHKVVCYASNMSKQEVLNLFEQNAGQIFTFSQASSANSFAVGEKTGSFGPGGSGSSSGSRFRWAIDTCTPAGCMMGEIGGQGTYSYVSPPVDACNASVANRIVTVKMRDPKTGATKDFKVMCTDGNGTGYEFKPSITGASVATYVADTGAANSTLASGDNGKPEQAVPALDKCKRGSFVDQNQKQSNRQYISTEWACECAGDFSSWVKQDNGCYHRNMHSAMPTLTGDFGPGPAAIPMPKPNVVFDKCKRGEFSNGSGQTMWACDCEGDFSSWVRQDNGCYHKNK